MPQQINLYTAVPSTQTWRFSALFMARALGAIILVGGALGLYEVMRLHQQSAATGRALRTETQLLQAMRLTIRQTKASETPAEMALAQALKERRSELLQLQSTVAALQQGILLPGEGHSARLALVARSIPATAWVTRVKADAERLEVSGFTFDPAALNDWITRLGASPLLAGQQLATINVAKVGDAVGAASDTLHPVWSFNLVKSLDQDRAAPGSSP